MEPPNFNNQSTHRSLQNLHMRDCSEHSVPYSQFFFTLPIVDSNNLPNMATAVILHLPPLALERSPYP